MNTAKQTVKKDSDFRTRSISKQTKKPINTEIGKTLTLGNVGEFLRDNTMSGLAQFNGGLAKTADFLLPDFITPKPVEKELITIKPAKSIGSKKLHKVMRGTLDMPEQLQVIYIRELFQLYLKPFCQL